MFVVSIKEGSTIAREQHTAAKSEIEKFLSSKEAGIRTELKASTLERAAQSLYTAAGKDCPVRVLEVRGQVYLINRAICDGTDNSTSTA